MLVVRSVAPPLVVVPVLVVLAVLVVAPPLVVVSAVGYDGYRYDVQPPGWRTIFLRRFFLMLAAESTNLDWTLLDLLVECWPALVPVSAVGRQVVVAAKVYSSCAISH